MARTTEWMWKPDTNIHRIFDSNTVTSDEYGKFLCIMHFPGFFALDAMVRFNAMNMRTSTQISYCIMKLIYNWD